MAVKRTLLLHRLYVPDDCTVQRLTVRRDEVLAALREVQVAHLRLRVDALEQRPVVGVPHFDALVLRPPSRNEHAGE